MKNGNAIQFEYPLYVARADILRHATRQLETLPAEPYLMTFMIAPLAHVLSCKESSCP